MVFAFPWPVSIILMDISTSEMFFVRVRNKPKWGMTFYYLLTYLLNCNALVALSYFFTYISVYAQDFSTVSQFRLSSLHVFQHLNELGCTLISKLLHDVFIMCDIYFFVFDLVVLVLAK